LARLGAGAALLKATRDAVVALIGVDEMGALPGVGLSAGAVSNNGVPLENPIAVVMAALGPKALRPTNAALSTVIVTVLALALALPEPAAAPPEAWSSTAGVL